MPESSPKKPVVLDSLLRHERIQAVVWIDNKGKVKARRGHAHSLRIGPDDPTGMFTADTSRDKPGEAVYITSFAQNDFLIIIFDEESDFDTLKEDVDTTVNLHN